MTKRENYLSIVKRTGYSEMPVDFYMCPSLETRFNDYMKEHPLEFDFGVVHADSGARLKPKDKSIYAAYYPDRLPEETQIDDYGVAHVKGSSESFHMTRMLHPLSGIDSVEQVLSFPFPEYEYAQPYVFPDETDAARLGNMPCTIWEQSWYLRGMDNLMVDMMNDDPIAQAILDKVTAVSVRKAEAFAKAGVDIIFAGDDIGMQNTPLMSIGMYCEWIKPRLIEVIRRARAIKEDMAFFYHSCGYIEPFIPHLIEAGIDVLNPVQPECMDFARIHAEYGDVLSFNGTIGTQTTMPFGTPEDVRREVFRNLDIAGTKGGLLVGPTHMLEPDVPIENVVAYINACKDYCG